MNKLLYSRLAAQNMRKNARFYLPYLLAIIGTVAGFYIVSTLALDPAVTQVARGAGYLSFMMGMGTFVIGLFAAIFLFYTNSFLIKRRKRELGLYNILGMEKRHIAAILAYESIYTALIGIGGGLLVGVGLYKLTLLALYRLLRFDVAFGFAVSVPGLRATVLLFAALLLLTLIANLMQIRHVKPIELLKGGSVGEREPRTRWPLTILGLLTLGGGYYIALTTRSGVEALALYFLAVILVIIGTYCLFTSVSIAALKIMRRNKRFYYRPNHFISVSGMIYRMKQNAVGLANICILSTMVMVMVSGTASLYAGTEEMINRRTPTDLVFNISYDPTAGTPDFTLLESNLRTMLEKNQMPIDDFEHIGYLEFTARRLGSGFSMDLDDDAVDISGISILKFITMEDYARLTDTEPVALGSDEVLLCGPEALSGEILISMPADSNAAALRLRVSGRMDAFPELGDMNDMVPNYAFVVRDDEALLRIYRAQAMAYDSDASSMRWEARIDVDASDQWLADHYAVLYDVADVGEGEDGYIGISLSCRPVVSDEAYTLNGCFLFLGLFLGLIFIIATVLIIYYKQVSEGYDDKARFEIMQKVGLSRREARRTINHQILMVFFLPLLVAAMHIVMDFRMMTQLLSLFQLNNTCLTLLCSAGTFAVFSLVYGAVYMFTARVYYKIVQ